MSLNPSNTVYGSKSLTIYLPDFEYFYYWADYTFLRFYSTLAFIDLFYFAFKVMSDFLFAPFFLPPWFLESDGSLSVSEWVVVEGAWVRFMFISVSYNGSSNSVCLGIWLSSGESFLDLLDILDSLFLFETTSSFALVLKSPLWSFLTSTLSDIWTYY